MWANHRCTLPQRPLSLIIVVVVVAVQFLSTTTLAYEDVSRTISIMNESGRRVAIYWMNPDDDELMLQSDPDILHGASFDLNSYVGHQFEVRELPKKRTNECGGSSGKGGREDKVCGVDYFTVSDNHDQGESTLSSLLLVRNNLFPMYFKTQNSPFIHKLK